MIEKILFDDIDGVLNAADVRIVVSSTWRILNDLESFCGRTLILAYLIHEDWRTDQLGGARWGEINEWLARHSEVETAVVIDDDGDAATPVSFIQSDGRKGSGKANWS